MAECTVAPAFRPAFATTFPRSFGPPSAPSEHLAYLTNGDLTGGDLTGGDLTGGDLTGGDLTDGDLTDGGGLTDGGLTDGDLAPALAGAAGRLLVGLRAEPGAWTDPVTLRRNGDQRSHDLLISALSAVRPGDAVLSEEGADDSSRLAADRVWIVDPLDGTREFGEEGRTDWAVHVALWERGELTAGAVALPACGRVLASQHTPARRPRRGPRMRLAVSRTRPPDLVYALASDLAAELVPMGSAGAKIAAVVLGAADAYVHAGGQYEWDSAAPVAVARAAGLHASRVDGSPLRYNSPDPLLPDLMVCRPELAEDLLDAVRRAERAA